MGVFMLLICFFWCIINTMKGKIFLVSLVSMFVCAAANAGFTCGVGYVYVENAKKVNGVMVAECQKLWCRDLETGKSMGSGERPASGYQSTNSPMEVCDAENNCIECWGARRWCAGEAMGDWNSEYGAYTRGGDNATYQSYQKGGCFAWRLEKPNCGPEETAVLQDGAWVCARSSGDSDISRESSMRRTGTFRRISK